MTEEQTINQRINDLEKQCHFFHMQVERMAHLYTMVQQHELQIYKLENPENGRDD
jgi:hypothetical protein